MNKLISEVSQLEAKLADTGSKTYSLFAGLNEVDQKLFRDFAQESKAHFFEHQWLNAPSFRTALKLFIKASKLEIPETWFKNANNYKETLKALHRLERYQITVQKIKQQARGFDRVTYDSRANTDRLDKMKFSHDTLLQYAFELVRDYPLLRRIIIDKHPFFFIDEYQDTHKYVVQLVSLVSTYAEESNKEWVAGYFGDAAQNIYDDGVGDVSELHNDLVSVAKEFNRRSHKQVVDVINNIRSDEIVQVPFDGEMSQGQVRLFHCGDSGLDQDRRQSETRRFLGEYRQDLDADPCQTDTRIHCLVQTNRMMAELNGFGEIIEAVRSAEGIYYADLNTSLLSHELEKLNPAVRLIFSLVKLHEKATQGDTSYYELFGDDGKRLRFSEADSLVATLQQVSATNLKELVSAYSALWNQLAGEKSIEYYTKNWMPRTFFDGFKGGESLDNLLKSFMLDQLVGPRVDDPESKLAAILSIELPVWKRWADFVDRTLESDDGEAVIYHTYHGTKGREFENVAIVMEESFGRKNGGRNKFKDYFIQPNPDLEKDPDKKRDRLNTKNLVYVACSRAKRNLRILYIDPVTEVNTGLEELFGEPELWVNS